VVDFLLLSSWKNSLQTLRQMPLLADLLALAAFAAYAAQMWNFAHTQFSVLDEGLYLYKGVLLASGQYMPFQDNGLWMNQMPLSYLIPGWVQVFFGPGLNTGRMFAFILGLFAVWGLYLTARRLGGRWISAGLVLALALNPAAMRMSAMAASQGLAACLLAWTLFFSLGKDRKPWELFLGGFLAGVVVMVRINLVLLLPLLLFYRLWEQRGLADPPLRRSHFWLVLKAALLHKNTLWLLAGMLLTFGGIHLAYWPNILRLWARWLPFPFLADFLPPPNTPSWQPEPRFGFRVASFFLAFRYHFGALFGALAALVFWPGRGKLKEEKSAVFLAFFLVSSFLLHAWASLGNEYCVFCFPTYTTFYAGAGLLLAAVTLPAWNLNLPSWRKWLGGLALLFLLGGMAYSAEGTVRDLLPENFYKYLLNTPMPGYEGVPAWKVLVNKYGLKLTTLTDAVQAYFPVLVAVALGLATLGLAKLFAGRKNSAAWAVGFVLLILIGMAFSPSPLLAGEYQAYDCPADVIPGYQAAGQALSQVIPPGSKVYWDGYSPVTLLYLPKIEILPGQLHGVYSYRISQDDAALRRYGWWNESMAEDWLSQVDFILVERRNFDETSWLLGRLDNFERVLPTKPQSCQGSSVILVYRRK
jgi:hypothetical protein